jgi:two-component system, OmpR family, response regulator RegX3
MTQYRVVVADDDPVTAKIIHFVLEDEGFDTVVVDRGAKVFLEVGASETHLVILDVNLPDVNGFSLFRELRARRYSGPVIFLTGHGEIDAKLEGFRLGAEDYVVKPFDPLELLARVQSVVRRFQRSDQQSLGSIVRVEDAELSIISLTYFSDIVDPVVLSPTEMKILECLMRNARIIISRETLIDRVWGLEFLGDMNRVDVYIRRIRRKIETDPTQPQYLHTVRGIGYVYRPQQEGADDLPSATADEPTLDVDDGNLENHDTQ